MKSQISYTVEEATRKMEHYCAYQERCHKEVVSRLRAMNMIPLAIDSIVTHLIEHNYLNEGRFAREYARGKFRVKKWGRNRIVRELKLREISRYNIEAALKEIPEGDYLDTLHEIASKRMGQITEPNKMKMRKKLADYLLYRGWESHLVFEKINELID